jgi:hypothetical protein
VNRLDFDLSGVAQKDWGGAENFSRSKPVASRHHLLRFKAKSANLAAFHRQGERSGCVWQLPRPGSRRACICELREILVARTQVDKGGLGGHGAELMHHREVVPNPPMFCFVGEDWEQEEEDDITLLTLRRSATRS